MNDIMTVIKAKRNEIARELGVTRQAVEQWTRVPSERCLEVERVTGISRHDLRPDIYGTAPGPFKGRNEERSAA